MRFVLMIEYTERVETFSCRERKLDNNKHDMPGSPGQKAVDFPNSGALTISRGTVLRRQGLPSSPQFAPLVVWIKRWLHSAPNSRNPVLVDPRSYEVEVLTLFSQKSTQVRNLRQDRPSAYRSAKNSLASVASGRELPVVTVALRGKLADTSSNLG